LRGGVGSNIWLYEPGIILSLHLARSALKSAPRLAQDLLVLTSAHDLLVRTFAQRKNTQRTQSYCETDKRSSIETSQPVYSTGRIEWIWHIISASSSSPKSSWLDTKSSMTQYYTDEIIIFTSHRSNISTIHISEVLRYKRLQSLHFTQAKS
jgi:hypothetical protein